MMTVLKRIKNILSGVGRAKLSLKGKIREPIIAMSLSTFYSKLGKQFAGLPNIMSTMRLQPYSRKVYES